MPRFKFWKSLRNDGTAYVQFFDSDWKLLREERMSLERANREPGAWVSSVGMA